jgi:hypothetical protein
MRQRIVMALHDAGGAAAVEPLISQLQKYYECSIYAFETAAKMLKGHEFSQRISLSNKQATDIISAARPDLVLTGTSSPGDTIDRALILAAKNSGIPTLSILDYWSNYRARFTCDKSDELLYLTDKIAVMNEDARTEMLSDGIPDDTIVITGSPRFSELVKKEYNQQQIRKKLSNDYGMSLDKPWILFLSQPFIDVFGGGEQATGRLGYTEIDSINTLTGAFKGKGVEIIARLHPRENESNRQLFNDVTCTFIQENDVNELICACDFITGISTVALIDAYLMKKPVISIQPNQKNEDLCYLSRCNLIPKCENAHCVETYFDKMLNDENFIDFAKGAICNEDSAMEIFNMIRGMLATQKV